MFIKAFIILIMIAIFSSLISGLIFLLKDNGTTNRTVKALSWRIGISLTLFIFLFIAFSMGWIQPHSI